MEGRGAELDLVRDLPPRPLLLLLCKAMPSFRFQTRPEQAGKSALDFLSVLPSGGRLGACRKYIMANSIIVSLPASLFTPRSHRSSCNPHLVTLTEVHFPVSSHRQLAKARVQQGAMGATGVGGVEGPEEAGSETRA